MALCIRLSYIDVSPLDTAIKDAVCFCLAGHVFLLAQRYLSEKTVLRTDALEVDARLAKAGYQLTVAEDGLVTLREHMNELMGRDRTAAFRVNPMAEIGATDLTVNL